MAFASIPRASTWTGIALVLLLAVIPLTAQTVTSTDELVFETSDDSMWGPEGVVSKEFQVYLLNEEFDPQHLRFMDGAQVPNPLYLAWKAAYDAAILLGFTHDEVINGKQVLTAEWLAWKATYDANRLLGWSDSEARNGKQVLTAEWLAWKATYDSLRALGWTDSQARNGKTTCVVRAKWIAWKACMEISGSTAICGSQPTKYSCTTLPGAGSEPTKYRTLPGAGPEPTKYTILLKGIGDAPPETIPVGTGIELDITNARLIGGFEGEFGLLDGGVDATYSAGAKIRVDDASVLPGQTVTLQTEKTWSGSPTLATNLTLMDTWVGTFMRTSGKLDFRVLQSEVTLFDQTILDFDTGMLHQEIAGLKVQAGPSYDLELRFFGEDVFSTVVPDQSYNLNFPFLIPFPYSVFFGFPMADVSLYVPEMQTPPHTWIDEANPEKVHNAQLPIEREILAVVGSVAGADKIRVDFAKFDVDFDVATVLAGWSAGTPLPLGFQAGVPVLAQVEVNVEDWDAGAFFSFAQEMSFEATQIEVRFHFSEPVGISGSGGTVTWVSEHTVELGDSLEFEHPGGTLTVTPEYLLTGNEFHNKTDLVISPVQTTTFLQIKFMGTLLTALGAPTDYTVYQGTLPLWEPIHAATAFDKTYALKGFNSVMGNPITVYGSVAPPVSDAGPDQVVHAGTLVTLDGSGSYDPDENVPLSYEWVFVSTPAGSSATLDGADTVSPTFTPDVVGDFVVRLIVTDAISLASEPDDVTVTAVNVPPIASAGDDQTVVQLDTVKLSGSGSSDADLDPLTYAWSFASMPAGSAAAFDDPAAVEPSFVADVAGEYVVRLVVHDGFASSEPDEMTVTVTPLVTAVNNAIQAMIDTINGLDNSAFSNKNHRKTLVNKLEALLKQVANGEYAEALDKLNNDVHAKMDGVPMSGAVDKTDWIVDAGAQTVLHGLYESAKLYLTRLL